MADTDSKSNAARGREAGREGGKNGNAASIRPFLRRLTINLLVVVIPVGAYWTFVLMRQQDYQIERGFRALGEIHRQAERKLAAVGDLFRFVPGSGEVPIQAYRKQLQPDLAEVRCLFNENAGRCEPGAQGPKLTEMCDGKPAGGPIARLDLQSPPGRIKVYPCHLLESEPDAAALVYFEVDPRNLFGASSGVGEFERVVFGTADRVLATLYPPRSRPALARSPHGPVADSEALLGLEVLVRQAAEEMGESADATGLSVGTTVNVEIAGQDYTAFVKPVVFALAGESELFLVGLRARADIVEAATEPDNRLLFLILNLVIVLIVGWPILRLGLRAQGHPVAFYELWRVGGALTVIGAVAVVAAYTYDAQVRAAGDARDAAKDMAVSVRDQLRTGIHRRAELLRAESTFEPANYSACGEPDRLGEVCTSADNVCLIRPDARELGPGALDKAGVPLLEVLGRTKPQGEVETPVMATIRCRKVPKGANLSGREYFQMLQGENPPALVAQRLANWANGEKMLQLAVPRGDPGGIATGDTRLAALALTPNPRRLEYAVFENATGTVLFHSDSRRALIENFFIETEDDAGLVGAVAAGRGGFVRARYYGRSFQFYYLPLSSGGDGIEDLETLDWGIAVGFDLDALWSIGLITWGNVIGVVLGFAALVWLSGYLLFHFRPTRHWMSSMIWPGGDFHAVLLPSASIGVIVLCAALLLPRDWAEASTKFQFLIVLVAVFAPVLAWIAGKTYAAGVGSVGGWRRTLWPYWLLLLFVAVGPVPALLLTPPAWSFHETVFRANQAASAMNQLVIDRRALENALPGLAVRVPDSSEMHRSIASEATDCRRPARGVAPMIWQTVPMLRDLLPGYRLDGPDPDEDGRFCFESMNASAFSLYDDHTGLRADVVLSAGAEPGAAGPAWLTALVWIITLGSFAFFCVSITRLLDEYRFIARNGGRPRPPLRGRPQILFVCKKPLKPPTYLAGAGLAQFDLLDPPDETPGDQTLWVRGFDTVVFGQDPAGLGRAMRAMDGLIRADKCCIIVTARDPDAIEARLDGFDAAAAECWRGFQSQLLTVNELSDAKLEDIQRDWRTLAIETRPAGTRAVAAVHKLGAYLTGAHALAGELNRRDLIELIGRELEPRYRLIWAKLDEPERLALYELSRGLLPGPKDAQILRTLESRGLCTLDPFPHIESESFEDFAASCEPSLREREQEHEQRPSAWRSLRTPLLIVVVLGIAWLAYSGGETVQILSAVLAATLGLATRLGQFAEFFRK